jgi:predicted DNA-binding helix-hairpin-helix protein
MGIGMDTLQRLSLLASEMNLEPAEDAGPQSHSKRLFGCEQREKEPFLSRATLPNGRQITLLKSLLSTACERNCTYCPFQAGRNTRRVTFKPDEMASTFIALHRAGIVEGIFLSSGIIGSGPRTQDKIIAVAEILRQKYQFRGYMHLKLMPGVEQAQVERTMQLADRVSVNLEAPNAHRLEVLAPRKQFLQELIQPLRWVEEIRMTQPAHLGWNQRWPSTTTQFVVGAIGESDLELISTTESLMRQVGLRRAYYSAFRPISRTPLENQPAENPVRQNRLYQASFLLRDYGFQMEELAFDENGRLPISIDPKAAWAQKHLSHSPIEINLADRRELLRIPGIGPRGATLILQARRKGALKSLDELRKLGINPDRSSPFILLDGSRPARQLPLF